MVEEAKKLEHEALLLRVEELYLEERESVRGGAGRTFFRHAHSHRVVRTLPSGASRTLQPGGRRG